MVLVPTRRKERTEIVVPQVTRKEEERYKIALLGTLQVAPRPGSKLAEVQEEQRQSSGRITTGKHRTSVAKEGGVRRNTEGDSFVSRLRSLRHLLALGLWSAKARSKHLIPYQHRKENRPPKGAKWSITQSRRYPRGG